MSELESFDLESLIGLSGEEAERRIQRAGYLPRIAPAEGPVTADIGLNRITGWTGRDGIVIRASRG